MSDQPDGTVVGGHPGGGTPRERQHPGLSVHGRRTLDAQQDLRTVVARRRVDLVAELVVSSTSASTPRIRLWACRRSVPAHPGASAHAVETRWSGVKLSTLSSSGTSTCLGVRPPRNTLSELAITLQADSAQIGVQVSGRQKDPLTRTQRYPVEQQRRQHTGIAGIPFTQLQHGLGFGREFRCARMSGTG